MRLLFTVCVTASLTALKRLGLSVITLNNTLRFQMGVYWLPTRVKKGNNEIGFLSDVCDLQLQASYYTVPSICGDYSGGWAPGSFLTVQTYICFLVITEIRKWNKIYTLVPPRGEKLIGVIILLKFLVSRLMTVYPATESSDQRSTKIYRHKLFISSYNYTSQLTAMSAKQFV